MKLRIVTNGVKFNIEAEIPARFPFNLFLKPCWTQLRISGMFNWCWSCHKSCPLVLFNTENDAKECVAELSEKIRPFQKVVYYKET